VDIVRFMRSQPLDFDPGTRYAYSNFGYCVLGRLIEHVTGRDYETHVRSRLLAPLGITRMRIGKTRPADRAQDEVCYYERDAGTGPCVWADQLGQPVPWPYGAYCVETMDAHGGWIASAVELVRFASRLYQPAPQGVLSAAAWSAMMACPPGTVGHEEDGSRKASYYGLGWQVRPVAGQGRPNLWHTGRFAGASSILVVRHDGCCWAALFNTSQTADSRAPAEKIDALVHCAVDAVAGWPQDDLFGGDVGLDLQGTAR
jgi:N-acyl-D-amino-acid deacylase